MGTGKNRIETGLTHLGGGIYFLFTFFFLFFFAEHIFYYQEKTFLFIFSPEILSDGLNRPGGFLKLLSGFLTSFYYYPMAGSMISSGVMWLTMISSAGIIRKITGHKPGPAPYIIGIFLFYLQLNYRYPLVNNLGIMLQLVAFYFFLKRTNWWIPVIFAPAWYFLTGSFSGIFFMMYFVFLALKHERGWWIRIFFCLVLLYSTFFLLKEYLLFFTVKDLLTFPWYDEGVGVGSKVFFAVVIFVIHLPLLKLVSTEKLLKNRIPYVVSSVSGIVFLIAGLVLAIMMKNDPKTSQYFHVEKLFYERNYEGVVDYCSKNPTGNQLTVFLINISLSETGQLNDLLFHFPQKPDGSTLFLKWEMKVEVLRRGGLFYYSIGMINEARRWAYENMVMRGPDPEGLKQIIKCELITGNYKSADKYIGMLRKTIFYRKDALYYEELSGNEAAINDERELGQKRREMLHADFFVITDNPLINLERILLSGAANKKAFDYRLALLLLSKDNNSIYEVWKVMKLYGYKKIPVHVEEALKAYIALIAPGSPVPGNLQLSIETEERFNRYFKTFQDFGADRRAAEPVLRKQFGNTYWYYVFYRQ